ncbi:MAG: serine hydrolase [Candidatus Bathyarchaeia archaeon]|nr:serine hydrolase [Candidatus Bathyarchaeota archaeon]
MSETKLPGLSISAIKDGEVVYSRGFGFRDLATGRPATPETLYCIGSVTKSFTCISIMQLQEKGLLDVEDPVEKYLPLSLRSCGEPVKIWHLMSHTSGIPALAYAEAVIRHTMRASERWLPISGYRDMFTFMGEAEGWAYTKPGERWFYLNEGYILLGYVIEKVSGEGYVDYVRRHILEPLGMRRSFFYKDEVEGDPDAATPYIVTKEGERIPSTYPYGAILSDGGLISNALDMAEYIKMYLNYGEYKGFRVLGEDLIREMMKPRVKTPDEPFISNYVRYYGYGLGINRDFYGYDLISHGGSVSVATAYMGFVPERKVGVMILANGSGYPLSYMGEYALALLLGRDPKDHPVFIYERVQEELEGVYETYKATMRAKVARRGSLLTLDMGDRYRELMVPLIPLEFKGDRALFQGISMDRKIPVEFIKDGGETYLLYERYKLRKIGRI